MSARWSLAAIVFLGLVRSALADPFINGPSQGQQTNDMAVCAGQTRPPVSNQTSVEACTRLINTGSWSGRVIALHNRCALFTKIGEGERAISDCDEAIRLNPDFVSAYNNRGAAYVVLGAEERAVQDYDRALRLDPNNAAAHHGRCYSLAVIGRAAEALVSCDRSLQLQPNDANALDSHGYAHLRLGLWAQAERDYDAAIAADATRAMSWFARAVVRAHRGDQAGAQADLAVHGVYGLASTPTRHD